MKVFRSYLNAFDGSWLDSKRSLMIYYFSDMGHAVKSKLMVMVTRITLKISVPGHIWTYLGDKMNYESTGTLYKHLCQIQN